MGMPANAISRPRGVSKECIQTSDSKGLNAFRNAFAILHNLHRWELEKAGLIAAHKALWALIKDRQTARYREAV